MYPTSAAVVRHANCGTKPKDQFRWSSAQSAASGVSDHSIDLHGAAATASNRPIAAVRETCLLEEPTYTDCEDVRIACELQAHACRKLVSEIVVARELQIGVAVVKVNVVNRSAYLKLRC